MNKEFGEDFDITLYTALPADTVSEYQRYLNTTEELIVSSMNNNKVRGLLRTAQSEYVALAGINTITTTWSIEFADDTDNPKAMDKITEVVQALTEQVLVVETESGDYNIGLTFNAPAGYTVQVINGTKYLQIVFSGRATVTDCSALANETAIYINGDRVNGLVSFSNGMTATGENYNAAGSKSALQSTTVQSLNTALSIDIHTIKGDPVATKLTRAMIDPESAIDENGAVESYSISFNVGNIEVNYPTAKLSDVQCAGSIGSYIVLSVRFMRK
jgi:hypothetical protein